jgi:hypothetical protein
MFLCTVNAIDLMELSGVRPDRMDPPLPKQYNQLIMIGQAPDCSSYLILTDTEHEKFVKQSSVPSGYDFIFRQSWGLAIDEDVIHRVISTLRAESYPPMADYLDAKVKSDLVQENAYLSACLAVKELYPKFSF